jgi:outer membrane protein OmpA-like peptidoglycan-associated protein
MNVIQPLLNSVTPQAWGSLAGALHETPEHTRQGLADALPMFFAGLIGKASTLHGASGLLAYVRNFGGNPDVERVAANGAVNPELMREGGVVAHSVLGERYDNVASSIARHAGVDVGSAQSLLGLAAPLALGGIARAAPTSGFTAEGLMRFLQAQRADVESATPRGLPHGLFDNVPDTTRIGRGRGIAWLVPAAVAVLLALALGQCMMQQSRETAVVAPPAVTPPRIEAPQLPTIQLPGGIALNAPANSIAYNLATFLGGALPPPRTFTFDNLNFDTGAIRVTPESTATLDQIATTLKAYPNAMVRLEGHTDSTGVRADNVQLSLDRATAVKAALVTRGVAENRLTAVGFGPDRPVADNATEQGRAANRRLELTVTSR